MTLSSLICVTFSQGSAVSSLQRPLVPLVRQQTQRKGTKKGLGFSGAQRNVVETSSLLPGQDTGRHKAKLLLKRSFNHMIGKNSSSVSINTL